MPQFSRSLFIFHRDLRLQDNTALLQAQEQSTSVSTCFIFDPRQLEDARYRSLALLAFMRRSISELSKEILVRGGLLNLLYGRTDQVVETLLCRNEFNAVFCNLDYTPFAQGRDKDLEKLCQRFGVVFKGYHDYLLHQPGSVLKDDCTPYTVYTPFAKRALKQPVPLPRRNSLQNISNVAISGHNPALIDEIPFEQPPHAQVQGGRDEAKILLERLSTLTRYAEDRDFPSLASTSLLSAHNKFGSLSIREVYHYFTKRFGQQHQFIKELLWRDFFTHIGFHFPRVFGKCFHPQWDTLEWHNNPEFFAAWAAGATGFPIVDAGMRELNGSGLMHNRVRMIAASFLVKDLHIDWRWGERYFAQRLVDYDPCVNNGNWQWVASTGCDAQPYFRIFNPWLQQQRFDPECRYIKRWVPELSANSPKSIHELEKSNGLGSTYPAPIVNHQREKRVTEELYSRVREGV